MDIHVSGKDCLVGFGEGWGSRGKPRVKIQILKPLAPGRDILSGSRLVACPLIQNLGKDQEAIVRHLPRRPQAMWLASQSFLRYNLKAVEPFGSWQAATACGFAPFASMVVPIKVLCLSCRTCSTFLIRCRCVIPFTSVSNGLTTQVGICE